MADFATLESALPGHKLFRVARDQVVVEIVFQDSGTAAVRRRDAPDGEAYYVTLRSVLNAGLTAAMTNYSKRPIPGR